MPTDRIPPSEHAARRKKTLTALKNAVGLVFAGRHDNADAPFRPHPHFEYLTGLVDEPGAALLLDPSHPVPARREVLFLAPLNRERERWDGYRTEIGQALRDRTGFETIFRAAALPPMLTTAATRSKRLACLHPFSHYPQPVSPDLAIFKQVQERVAGLRIEDHSQVLSRMRAVKSSSEIAMIQRAIDITAAGFEAMMRSIRPGLNEFDVQEIIEHAYRTSGARGPAFPTIAGSGLNSTVLHYRANDQPLAGGDLICVDSGAAFGGYSADVTRTVPVGGTFSKRQREIYELVLRAETEAIKAVRPGARLARIDDAARRVITRAGLADHFIHSIGHHLGLETHDISPEEPLRVGAVITIEPGIYIREESIGVRIEDDILVTKAGARNLSARIPRTVAAVEKVMSRSQESGVRS